MSTITEQVTGIGQTVWSENLGAELKVAACYWSQLSALAFGQDAIIAGEITASGYTATQDGRDMRSGWHSGEEADAIYVERWEGERCVFHGWIDSASRQIVQAG